MLSIFADINFLHSFNYHIVGNYSFSYKLYAFQLLSLLFEDLFKRFNNEVRI